MNLSTPIFALTVSEFSELIQEQLKSLHPPLKNQSTNLETDNVDINWVSENLKIPKSTIHTKVCRMELPCKKRGKPLVFSKNEIIEWNEKGRPKVFQEIDFAPAKNTKKIKKINL
jgi:hypothetical protein